MFPFGSLYCRAQVLDIGPSGHHHMYVKSMPSAFPASSVHRVACVGAACPVDRRRLAAPIFRRCSRPDPLMGVASGRQAQDVGA